MFVLIHQECNKFVSVISMATHHFVHPVKLGSAEQSSQLTNTKAVVKKQ